MIHVYDDGNDRIVDLNGTGKTLLDDFAALCGTMANDIIIATDTPEDKVVWILSMAMAQGISERNNGRKDV